MLRSASSDLDTSTNPSHGTQLARGALLASGGSTRLGTVVSGDIPVPLPSPFASSSTSIGGAGGSALLFSPFAEALQRSRGEGGAAEGGAAESRGGSASPPDSLTAVPPSLRNNSASTTGAAAAKTSGAGSVATSLELQQAEVDTWVVVEYANRGTLQRALEDGLFSVEDLAGNRRPNMRAVLTAAQQLAAAMAYMHARGVIHGDLSRANILLMDSQECPAGFEVKVADFGMARQLDAASRIDTFSCGTITHTAPELMDEGHLSRATDVFAGGVLMWELLAGCGAWSGMNQAQIISAVLIHNKRPVFSQDAPPAYAALAEQCMSTKPKERPTFAEVERRVTAMLHDLDAGDATTAGQRIL